MPQDYINRVLDRFFAMSVDHIASPREHDLKREINGEFMPQVRALDVTGRSELICALANVAVSVTGRPEQAARQNALHFLSQMRYPWPEDDRALLLPAREILLREFNGEVNALIWSNWQKGDTEPDWIHGPAYALILHSILLVIVPREVV